MQVSVDQPREHQLAAKVDDLHTADHAVGRQHRHRANAALAKVLLYLGDDVDRPLLKSDGSFTYFASDIAYHKNKYERGFARVIDVWGADHGGYVARVKAAIADALQAETRAQACLKSGDFACYGREQQAEHDALARAAELSGAQPSPTPSPSAKPNT